MDSEPQQLMAKARNGDKAAFGKLYQLYYNPLFRFILAKVVDDEVAADLTQTVFVKVMTNLPRYQEKGHPLAYFYTAARNAVTDHWRRQRPVVDDPEPVLDQLADSTPTAAEQLDDKERRYMILRTISKLPADQQEIITMKFINGLTNAEISQITGKSEAAVRQLQHRGLKNLRDKLQREVW